METIEHLLTSSKQSSKEITLRKFTAHNNISEKIGQSIIASLQGGVHVFTQDMTREERHAKLRKLAGE